MRIDRDNYEEVLEEITNGWFKSKSKDELIDIFFEDKLNDFETQLWEGEINIEELYEEYVG